MSEQSHPESSEGWAFYENHYELQGDGFHVSYNPATSNLGAEFAGDQEEETALCRRLDVANRVAYILNGDWRKGYEAHIDQGWDACYGFYQEHKAEHQSRWSSDYEGML